MKNNSAQNSSVTSNPNIHPTAIIHPTAQIAASVTIGAYSIVGPQVSIDEDCDIGPHVVIAGLTRIGKRNRIFQFASIGEICQDLKFKGEETWLEIGDDNIIREACTLHRGTVQDQSLTRLGHRNLLMVNTHIAHDCMIGNDNIFANNVGIAGHVSIGDHTIIGGNSGVHQFCRIDSYSMIGGGSTILKDVPAYTMVSGNPAHAYGMNYEGMRRKGWDADKINNLRKAFKMVYRENLTTVQAVDKLTNELLPQTPEVQLLIDSLTSSKRGIVR
ncbi:acyl-ACP--UDP-N-acetylglucosamine O-acyltransferase [Alkanindiges illinoisensis]|uniref:acyl-ACP--UDP-N-acetylglucosamine O-acyltransferase n=1 Tax=Alkanindiges illinoisensis TaxID=197183 RepID=UPI000B1E00EB